MDELMLDQKIQWNGNYHEIKVFANGKVLIKVISIYPDMVLNLLDYSSLDYLRKKLTDQFTLAYQYIGSKGTEYVDKIENAIFN